MELQHFLSADQIFTNIAPLGPGCEGGLNAISRLLSNKCGLKESVLLEGFLAREKLETTNFGDGIAILHTKLPGNFALSAAVIQFDQAIAWGPAEAGTIQTAVAFVVPEPKFGPYLDILSSFTRKLAHEEFCDGLKNIHDAAKLYRFILQETHQPS